MKIDIKATNLKLTDDVYDYLEKKIMDIDKRFFSHTEFPINARVELGRTTYHHKSGDIYRAEINLHIPGKKILRAEAEAETIFAAIDLIKDEIQREIKQYKETLITKSRIGERMRKFLNAYSPLSWFRRQPRKEQ